MDTMQNWILLHIYNGTIQNKTSHGKTTTNRILRKRTGPVAARILDMSNVES